MLYAEEIARILEKHVDVALPEIMTLLEQPPNPEMGDIAFPCFNLSKSMKKAPHLIAQDVVAKLKAKLPVDNIITIGPYINFFLNKALLAEKILNKKPLVIKRKEKVMVEHSNGNTHKEAHIGHLRNLSLGDSLTRILRAAGYPVVNAYYINDTGAHVARCLWALEKFHKDEKVPELKLKWLGSIYAEGAQKAKENEADKKEVDAVLQKLESNDKEVTTLWKKTRQWSLDDWHRIFEQLEMLPFDAKFYDSEVIKDVPKIIERMHKKGILKESEGALIADLEKDNLNVAVLKKTDGTTPYLAKDLALAERKFKEYEIDKSVYVVGSEQELHFQQLFKLLEKDGFAQSKNCYHLSYGLIMLASGKMSSREGTAILFDEFYQDVYDHALDQVKLRHEEWPEKKQISTAKSITLAAIKLPLVVQEPQKRIIFDIRKALDFEGETGPYVQYTFARLCSIMRKHGKKITNTIAYEVLCSPEEQALIKLLSKEEDIVLDAAEKYRPATVARYVLDVAKAANTFYHAQSILKESEDVKRSRLYLVLKTKEVIGRMLNLCGIPALEEM